MEEIKKKTKDLSTTLQKIGQYMYKTDEKPQNNEEQEDKKEGEENKEDPVEGEIVE